MTERTNKLIRSQITSNINLIKWNERVNLIIKRNEPNLIQLTNLKKAKKEQLVRVTMCDGGELHHAFVSTVRTAPGTGQFSWKANKTIYPKMFYSNYSLANESLPVSLWWTSLCEVLYIGNLNSISLSY